MPKKPLTYASAGVDLSVWNITKKKIATQVTSTFNKRVLGKFGQFGGLFSIAKLTSYKKPVLVSSIDGVGTKIKIAIEAKSYRSVGQDIVNHCINDILVLGAEPLFFLDYLGIGTLKPQVAEQVVAGVAQACKAAGCVLIGGETAEMPDVYAKEDFDLAGTIVGLVDEDKIIDGSTITNGDVIIGLQSSGLHTNGFSLARKIVVQAARKKYTDSFIKNQTFADALLVPHRAYTPVISLMRKGLIKGCAHITGGGFQDNVDRMLPAKCNAVIDTRTWEPLPIFKFLQKAGNVVNDEMYHTFNMGIGLVMAVSKRNVARVLGSELIKQFEPKIIGEIVKGTGIVEMRY